jgi:NADPH:quinone reductase-like Zn-dependent oxidoreductase
MKAVQLTGPGLANLKKTSLADPKPRPGEALIRLQAASLNYLDIVVANGHYPGVQYPIVPVTDGAGVIVEIVEDASGFAIGDVVIPHFMPDWLTGPIPERGITEMRGVTQSGSLAEFLTATAGSLIHAPKHLNVNEAATMPIAATTAWNAIKAGDVRPGKTVLLLGTGGVSLYALQFAKACGAEVIITSSSDAKLTRASALGATHTINYCDMPDWGKTVLELTSGRGVDLVVETGGGATFTKSIESAAFGGTVFVIGFVTGADIQLNVFPILQKNLRVQGNTTGSVADLQEAARAMEVNTIKPIIDRTFAFDDAVGAYELMSNGQHFGKLVIEL